ncbi:cytosine permease [Nesterenkonia sp. CL21]|uniref:purine-cytosine permease family protein n=1 Tax=Nesterenkonia sp. CL21 TaxID=3064894 RepID=UPI0028786A18|nr:cytosine permease [Nesterenkonia sp. CL21]MDS2173085.1 cytosine permease [Nesterenkonia sp. CL21]
MNLYRRLDQHLETHSETGQPVVGELTGRRIFMIWLAANLVVTTMLTGTLFVPGIGYGAAATAILIGTLVGAAVLTAVGAIGTRTGLATMALTRGPFGLRGSMLPVAANVTVLMGWSWVQAMLAGITVDHLIAGFTGWANPVLWSVVCEIIVVSLAIFGHSGIAKVEPWLAVFILAVMGYVFYLALSAFSVTDFQALPEDPEAGMTSIIALDIVIATAISWTVLSADFNRFARTPRAGVVGSGLGYTTSTVLAMLLGLTGISYLIASGTGPEAFDPVAFVEGFGTPVAVVIFFSVMATNTMAVYGMTTSAVGLLPGRRFRFLPTALVLGGVSVLGSTWLALLDQFTDFLVMISAFFIPVFAILLIDYYLLRRGRYTRDILNSAGGAYWYRQGVNWRAFLVWFAGAASIYCWTYVWPLAVGASIPAFLLSAAAYLALSWHTRSPGRAAPASSDPDSPAQLSTTR